MDTDERPARPTWADSGQTFRTSGMPRLGPQAERSSAWVNRDGEVQPPTQREVGDVVSRETVACCVWQWCVHTGSSGDTIQGTNVQQRQLKAKATRVGGSAGCWVPASC